MPGRALLAPLILSLSACGPPSTQAVERARGTLVIARHEDVGSLLDVVSTTSSDGEIMRAIQYPLVEWEFDCALKMRPALATRWEWSEDGRVLSMHLRDDIRFEDGTPITTRDLALTWELVADPAVASPYASVAAQMEPDGRPRVVDDHHLQWHFTQAYDRTTQLAHAVSVGANPAHLLADADRATLRSHPYGRAPLASGPWRLARYEPGSRLILEPNPRFTGPEDHRPRLDRVVFRILPDYHTRLVELQSGGVDLVVDVALQDAGLLAEEHPELRLERTGWRSMEYVGWNLNSPLFADARVRRALAHAVDVDAIIDRQFTSTSGEVYARRAIGTISPALCGKHADHVVPMPYEADTARALLAQAGWKDRDGDGWLDRGGQRFSFALATNAGNKRRRDVATLLRSQLQQVGVEVRVETIETHRLVEQLRERDFDAVLFGWSADLFVDPSPVWQCETKDRAVPYNFTSYCSPEVDDLIRAGLAAPRAEDSDPIWKAMQARIHQDQPYLFLYWMDRIVAVHQRFEGVTVDLGSPYNHLHRWSVPPDQVRYER